MKAFKVGLITLVAVTLSLIVMRVVYAPSAITVHGRIAFQSNRDQVQPNRYDIYVMNMDGSGLTRLTNTGSNKFPAFSPDGKYIAFASGRAGRWGLYIMDADGSNVRRLTNDINAEHRATWSPDGKRLAFASNQRGQFDIYAINVDGTGLVNLTRHPTDDAYPAWSPDGQYIAFSSARAATSRIANHQIYIMNTDGSNLTKLTNYQNSSTFPVWLPTGNQLIFQVFEIESRGWFVSDVENKSSKQLLRDDFYTVAWSPDMRFMVAARQEGIPFRSTIYDKFNPKTFEIYLVDMTAHKSILLTHNNFDDTNPTWAAYPK